MWARKCEVTYRRDIQRGGVFLCAKIGGGLSASKGNWLALLGFFFSFCSLNDNLRFAFLSQFQG